MTRTIFTFMFFSLWPLVCYAHNHQQQETTYKPVELTNGLYWLSGGRGGNIILSSGEDGILLIDDDYGDLSPALEKVLMPFGGVAAVDFIINTHWHGDHTGGNLLLGKSGTIVAHDNVRSRLSSRQEIPFFDTTSEPYPKHGLPTVTYKSTMTIHHNGDTLELVHFPRSHTDSDSVVFFKKANLVHMGDLFFNGFFPFIDVNNGGNVVSLSKSVDLILQRIDDKTIVVPGHGAVSHKAELIAFNDMLKGTTSEIEKLKTQGLTLEQAQKIGLSDKWTDWTKGFIPVPAWIAIIYGSL